jgi:hypothetical protein
MARFLIDNRIDNAVITSTPNMFPGLPIDNVKLLSKSLVARNESANDMTIFGNILGQYPVNCFVICGHNFKEGTNYKLETWSSPIENPTFIQHVTEVFSVTAEQAAEDILNNLYYLPIYLDTKQVGSFKLTVDSGTVNNDNFQIYRLFCGEYIEPEIQVDINNSIHWKDNTRQYRTDAGTLRSDIISTSKVMEFSIGAMREADRIDIQRLLSTVGLRHEFFIDLFPEGTERMDYKGVVKLTRIPKYLEFADNIYSSRYIVEEI